MNGTLQQIVNACVPVLCLLITAGGAYLVALLRKRTAQIQKEIDNATASKYMDMACEAVAQAVTYTAQTFVDTLKAEGAFTKEKQIEAFNTAKDKVLEILGDTVVAALGEIYGDFDAWLETKIEQVCREIKVSGKNSAATAVQQPAAEVGGPEEPPESCQTCKHAEGCQSWYGGTTCKYKGQVSPAPAAEIE